MRAIAASFLATLPHIKKFYVSNKWLVGLLKGLISIAAGIYIYHQISAEGNTLRQALLSMSSFSWGLILIACILLTVNLACEALKWKMLLRPYYSNLNFVQAYWGVLSGLTLGLFTPNRIGEYVGRLWYLKAGYRKEAAVLTYISRLYQLFATILGGIIGWYYLDSQGIIIELAFPQIAPYLFIAFKLLLWSAMFGLGFILLFFSWQGIFVFRSFFERLGNALPVKLRIKLASLSIVRYAVFSLQYVLLLYAVGYQDEIGVAFALVGLVFIVKSMIPSISFAELGIRESVAITIMGIAGVPASVAFLSTFLLFICNLILPAILGLVGIYRLPAVAKK